LEELKEKIREKSVQELAPGPIRLNCSYIFTAILLLALVVFIVLAFLARTVAYFPIDLAITQFLQTIDQGWFEHLMRAVSWPGRGNQSVIVTSVLVILIYWVGLRWEAVVAAVTGAVVPLLNLVLKIIIQRPRPHADIVDVLRELNTFSFPSGHVMYYAAFYGFLLYISFSLLKNFWLRTALVIIFGGLVLLVGPSRIYLGVHWPGDVLGAYIIGGLSLFAAIQFYRWGRKRFLAGGRFSNLIYP
jgi:undecaprenyl-diphosphatase